MSELTSLFCTPEVFCCSFLVILNQALVCPYIKNINFIYTKLQTLMSISQQTAERSGFWFLLFLQHNKNNFSPSLQSIIFWQEQVIGEKCHFGHYERPAGLANCKLRFRVNRFATIKVVNWLTSAAGKLIRFGDGK